MTGLRLCTREKGVGLVCAHPCQSLRLFGYCTVRLIVDV